MRLAVVILGALLLAAPAVRAEPPPPGVSGLYLITEFPALSARAGETATIKLKLQNYAMAPTRAALSVGGLPQGWRATILGGGQPVAAAMPSANEAVPLSLAVDIPAGAAAGTYNLVLRAAGENVAAELPIQLALGAELPARLGLKSKFPSLRGTAKSSFEFQFTARNDSGKDLVVKFAANAPTNFQTAFTEGYGTQEISSTPIEAGQSKDIKLKVTPPGDVAAGSYPVSVQLAAEGVSADAEVALEVTGQPKVRLVAKDGRLSGTAEAGKETPVTMVVHNDGGAPAENVELSASPPSEWKVDFEPKKIELLAPGDKREVQATFTPAAKALAGDYMTTIRANAKGDSSSADYRVTVTTSTLWGMVGIGIVAIALLIVVGAVSRFGRR